MAQSDWSYGVETDFPLGDLIANPATFKITDTEFFTNTSLTITTGSFNDVVYIGKRLISIDSKLSHKVSITAVFADCINSW